MPGAQTATGRIAATILKEILAIAHSGYYDHPFGP
jgi:hypothetical protein